MKNVLDFLKTRIMACRAQSSNDSTSTAITIREAEAIARRIEPLEAVAYIADQIRIQYQLKHTPDGVYNTNDPIECLLLQLEGELSELGMDEAEAELLTPETGGPA